MRNACLYELLSLHLGLSINIDRLTLVILCPVCFAAIIHLPRAALHSKLVHYFATEYT